MSVNWPMLQWGGHRIFRGRSPDVRNVAEREWVICPEETAPTRPAIYPDGALERITDLSPWRKWEVEQGLIRGDPIEHAATRAHRIGNAAIAGAFIYRGGAKSRHGYGKERLFDTTLGPCRHLETVHIVSNFAGSNYFGNFLLDDMPLGMIPEEDAPTAVMVTRNYEDEGGYRALLDLPRPQRLRHARIGELIVYTDFAQNSFKLARYRALRDRLRRHFPAQAGQQRPLVYLKRGATGVRRLIENEAELEEMLARAGFDIVEPSALSVPEVARRTLGAGLVISVEGSHLSHVIYSMADDGAFLILQPPDRFAMAYKEFADRMDMPFGFVVGMPVPGGFRVDLAELQRMIGKMT